MGEIRNLSSPQAVVLQFVLDAQDPTILEKLIGPQGARGLQGTPGTPGAHGKDGKDGLDGKNGLDGSRGEPGAPGMKGDKGETGPRGWSPTKEELKALVKEVLAGL